MRNINLFIIYLLAPFIGMAIVLSNLPGLADSLTLPVDKLNTQVKEIKEGTYDIKHNVGLVSQSLEEQQQQYEEHKEKLQQLAEQSQEQKNLSDEMYEQKILKRLGEPVKEHRSDRVEIKIFSLQELDYRGYIAKVKLFDPEVVKIALGQGKYGKGETTLNAVKRTGAILGVNGGGFYPVYQDGKKHILPIGTTMIDGEFVGKGFSPSHDNLAFAGFTKKADLIGGIFHKKENLLKHNPYQGISFVPMLIKNHKPLDIPEKWRNEKQPRTILGEYGKWRPDHDRYRRAPVYMEQGNYPGTTADKVNRAGSQRRL